MKRITMKGIPTIVVLMLLAACGGDSGGGQPSLDSIAEGEGPALNLSKSEDNAAKITSIITQVKEQLFEVLPDSKAENDDLTQKLCTDKTVTLDISSTPEKGGTAGLIITGTLSGEFTGPDTGQSSVDLAGVFNIKYVNLFADGKMVQLTGNASHRTVSTVTSGASGTCQTPPVHSTVGTVTRTDSAVFAMSGDVGGKVAYDFTLTETKSGIQTDKKMTGTATLISAGEEVSCAISGTSSPVITCP